MLETYYMSVTVLYITMLLVSSRLPDASSVAHSVDKDGLVPLPESE